ncbi:hypothetical protein ACFOZ0_03935 [Streptomyces yaanensis]|uniref:Uncharacterized protein n=1 Tax=Streptomyces yaanensis TaxID=1142239 RepID=A0ABV7S7N0_9ACTN|nr:hypothetical protein [Streptomyces sp. CGMCC 4.7035]WNC03358.1 hypothetical protein Q2K21_19150 [Streptomyces sp. CGMCC 4.7035]
MDRLELGKQLSSASEQADQPQRSWWPLDALPEPIVDYTRAALEAISHGTLYTSMGWT